MPFDLRAYHPSHLVDLYRICLLTGRDGADATPDYHDPDLLGHYYMAPYAVFEPDLCFVVARDGRPCGYILGARDSTAFSARCERDWFPALRARYPLPADTDSSPDAELVRLIHYGRWVDPDLLHHPAHLHIDLLPEAQGQGWGRRLTQVFLDRLRALDVPGVHLGVSKSNPAAIAFYERVGFQLLKDVESALILGMRL